MPSSGEKSGLIVNVPPLVANVPPLVANVPPLPANVPPLVVYLDNLESLLVCPDKAHGAGDGTEFGEWRSPGLKAIWSGLVQFAKASDRLAIVASCRYRHDDFGRALLTVSPLPPDALYRLMAWFPALRQLSGSARRLVDRLAGHPRPSSTPTICWTTPSPATTRTTATSGVPSPRTQAPPTSTANGRPWSNPPCPP